MEDKRLSRLVDMLVIHIVYGRTMKALKIAQYLRKMYGWHTYGNLDLRTGFRNYQAP